MKWSDITAALNKANASHIKFVSQVKKFCAALHDERTNKGRERIYAHHQNAIRDCDRVNVYVYLCVHCASITKHPVA